MRSRCTPSEFDTGGTMTFQNENPKIGDPEQPNGFSHTQINEAFKPLSPGDHGMTASDQYAQIAAQWESGVQVFAARIRRSSAAAWEGPAAEQSRQAIGNYATRAEDLVPALNALAVQVYDSVVSIMRTQNNLPDVPVRPRSRHGIPADGRGCRSTRTLIAATRRTWRAR